MKTCNNRLRYSNKVFGILLLGFVLFQLAFYKLMVGEGDIVKHMEVVCSILTQTPIRKALLHIKTYPLYHITTGIVTFFCLGDYNVASMCVLTMANVAAIIVARYILWEFVDENSVLKKYIVDIVSIAYLIFEPIAGYLTEGRVYARNCGPNPWHNPTITFVRPIGLIAFFLFIQIIKNMSDNKEIKNYKCFLIWFSVTSALSVWAKPSFMMVFLPAMGIYTFIFWMKDLRGRFVYAMQLLVAVLPTIVIILWSMVYIQYVNDETTGWVQFCIGGFSHFRLNEIIKVCIATFPVPLFALVLYGKDILKSEKTRVSYIALFIGVLEMFMLTNGESGDFSWGYDLAVGLSTVVVLGESLSMRRKKQIWRSLLLFGIFSWQVVIGLNYVLKIYQTGGGFWF